MTLRKRGRVCAMKMFAGDPNTNRLETGRFVCGRQLYTPLCHSVSSV